jgi:cytochrome c biogenesis protein CcdA
MGKVSKALQITLILCFLVLTNIIVNAEGDSVVEAYGSGCYGCFHTYEDRLQRLEEINLAQVEAKHFTKVSGAENELEKYRRTLNVPDDWKSKTTIVVDGKYIFEYEVPVAELEFFLRSDYEKFDSLVVRKGLGYYELIVEENEPVQCEDMDLAQCIASQKVGSSNTLSLILVSGFLDGINPCAFTVLILFVGLLTSRPEKERESLIMGSLYIVTIFLTYMAIGLSLYRIVELSQTASWIATFGGLVMIAMGLLNLYEFIRGKGFTLRMPFSGQMEIYNWMSRLTFPATVVAGVLVAIFEFPCTGAVYFSIISLLASTETFSRGYVYLLIYNIVFILPLIIVFILTWVGENRIKVLGASKHKYLKLLSSLLFISLGLYLIFK